MNRNRRLVLVVSVVAVLLGAASLATWRSSAARAAQLAAAPLLDPIPGGPGFLMVNPFQFRPHSPSDNWGYNSADLYNVGPGSAEFDAALTLPNNVTITQLTLYFYDNSAEHLGMSLYRCDPATGVCDVMKGGWTWDAEDQYRVAVDTDIAYAEIDQQRYSYLLAATFTGGGESLRLSGVRIDYVSGKASLPIVTKDH